MKKAVWLVFAALAAQTSAAADCPPAWEHFRPPDSDLQICWELDKDALHVEMSHPGRVWIALGFGAAMAGANAVVGRPETGEVLEVFIGGYDADSIVPAARQNLKNHSVVFGGGRTTVKFSRPLGGGDAPAIVAGRPTPVIWAAGEAPGFSGHFSRGAVEMDWGRGAAFAWNAKIILHVVLMLAAWGLMMPLGVVVARYYKVTAKQDFPRELDNQFWWHWHLALQYGGMLFAAAGIFAVWNPQKEITGIHPTAGIAAMALGVLQIVSGLLRGSKGGPADDNGRPNPPEKIRGDHYDMTRRRRVFEFIHKKGGYAVLAAGLAATVFGLRQTGAHWGAYAALFIWVGFFCVCFLRLQKSGKWVDTYRAIWGADTCHPGNRPGGG